MSSPVTIAVDCMGGDHGVTPIVEGALQALTLAPDRGLRVVLVGDAQQIEADLQLRERPPAPELQVQHAPEVVPMDAPATEGIRRKDTSIAVGLKLHQEGAVQAFISTGNTGAVMAAALRHLDRLPGVIRPAIASIIPNQQQATVVLDVGANSEVRPQHLLQFGIMGSVFSQLVLKHPRPRVGLLSIGEEPSKGTETIQAAHQMLAADKEVQFVGNIEGRDILSGRVDVCVTDGFVGNVLLKFAESVGPLLEAKLRHQINTNIFSRFGAFLLQPFLRRTRNSLDYAEYGGAPLLGIDGVVIICHGSSGAKAIKNAVFEAERTVRQGVNSHIKDHLRRVRETETTHAA